jgi:hypothetical protein
VKKFRRVGDAVDVPALGGVSVERGAVIEVEDTDVSASLEKQDGWKHIPDPKRSAAAKKAAASETKES